MAVYILCFAVKFFFEICNCTGLEQNYSFHKQLFLYGIRKRVRKYISACGVDQMNRRQSVYLPSITEKTVPLLTSSTSYRFSLLKDTRK
jgi:hypothetical protein